VRDYAADSSSNSGHQSHRLFCIACGSRVADKNKQTEQNEITLYPSLMDFAGSGGAGLLPDDWLPTAHIYWNERIVDNIYDDGLPHYAETSESQQVDIDGNVIKRK